MTQSLLIDFGATHIKSIVANKKRFFKNTYLLSHGSASKGNEVPVQFFLESLNYHLKNAFKYHKISSIIMCCEMHGFFYKYSNNISNYFSWRFADKHTNKVINIMKNKRVLNSTNIFPRPGLPIVTLSSLAKKKNLKKT